MGAGIYPAPIFSVQGTPDKLFELVTSEYGTKLDPRSAFNGPKRPKYFDRRDNFHLGAGRKRGTS